MGIKDKPMEFATEDLNKFRSHDPERAEGTAETTATAHVDSSGMDVRITKTVRMRHRYSLFLKEEAYRLTLKTGTKISEADLLDEALADWEVKTQLKRKREK